MVNVDGEIQEVSGFIENSQVVGDNILIPLKSIGTSLGCDVVWTQDSAWVYAKDFNGERMVTETKLDTVDIINDETYLQTLNSMLRSRNYSNMKMDYLNLTDGVNQRFRDLHNHYNEFFKLINNVVQVFIISTIQCLCSTQEYRKTIGHILHCLL